MKHTKLDDWESLVAKEVPYNPQLVALRSSFPKTHPALDTSA